MSEEEDTTGQEPNSGAERPADQQRDAASGQGQAPNQQPDAGSQSQDDWLEGLPPQVKDALRQARGEAAKHRVEAREARTRLQEYEDAQKTEAQRTAERLEAAEAKVTRFEHAELVRTVAKEKGVPAEWADLLQGDDRAALEERADQLVQRLAPLIDGNGHASDRYIDFDAGVRGGSPGSPDMNQMLRRSAGRG